MHVFTLFLLLFFSTHLCAQHSSAQAQIQKLQNDANVVWMGEIYRDLTDLGGAYEGEESPRSQAVWTDNLHQQHHPQTTSIIKLERAEFSADGDYWERTFFAYVFGEKTEVYADAQLSRRLSWEEKRQLFHFIDTFPICEPLQFDQTFTTKARSLEARFIAAYRLRELVYYDQQKNIYALLPLAIAPIVAEYDGNGNYQRHKTLFWLPIRQTQRPIKRIQRQQHIPYIKSVQMQLPFAEFTVLKNKLTWADCNQLWLQAVRQKNYRKSLASSEQPKRLLKADERAQLGSKQATTNTLPSERIHSLRVNHIFFWNSREHQLYVDIFSIAPVVPVTLDDDNFLQKQCLFYYFPNF